jgi:hypothetical protein
LCTLSTVYSTVLHSNVITYILIVQGFSGKNCKYLQTDYIWFPYCRLSDNDLHGIPEGNRPQGRLRRRWVDNVKRDIKFIGLDGIDWIDVARCS